MPDVYILRDHISPFLAQLHLAFKPVFLLLSSEPREGRYSSLPVSYRPRCLPCACATSAKLRQTLKFSVNHKLREAEQIQSINVKWKALFVASFMPRYINLCHYHHIQQSLCLHLYRLNAGTAGSLSVWYGRTAGYLLDFDETRWPLVIH